MGDLRRIIAESWQGAADPSAVLRRLFVLDKSKYPAELVGSLLEGSEPDDDRVWLAKANRALAQVDPLRV